MKLDVSALVAVHMAACMTYPSHAADAHARHRVGDQDRVYGLPGLPDVLNQTLRLSAGVLPADAHGSTLFYTLCENETLLHREDSDLLVRAALC